MKETYIAPTIEILKVGTQSMIALSGVYGGDSDSDIDYGGIDEGGLIEPE